MQEALTLRAWPMTNAQTLSQYSASNIERYLSDQKRKAKNFLALVDVQSI
jgi:hypothetical protein